MDELGHAIGEPDDPQGKEVVEPEPFLVLLAQVEDEASDPIAKEKPDPQPAGKGPEPAGPSMPFGLWYLALGALLVVVAQT